MAAAIELTRSLRRWRELAGVAPGSALRARHRRRDPPARRSASPGSSSTAPAPTLPIATVGAIEILPSADLDPEAVAARID